MTRAADHEIPERWLLDRLDGVLAPARAAQVESHLAAGCGRCEAGLRSMRTLRARIADGPLAAPPRSAVRRAVRLFAAARRSAWLDRAAEGVRRVVGTLVFDQALAPAAALRGAEGEVRRIVWALGEDELFVSLVSGPRGWSLDGQLLVAADGDAAGARVRLCRDGRALGWIDVGADGRFAAAGLRPGLYRIEGERRGTAFGVPAFALE